MSHMLDVQIREEALKRPEPKKKKSLEETKEHGAEGAHSSKGEWKEEIHPADKKGKTGNTQSNYLPLQSGHSASINIGKEIRKRLFMENVDEEELERDQIFGRLIRN